MIRHNIFELKGVVDFRNFSKHFIGKLSKLCENFETGKLQNASVEVMRRGKNSQIIKSP
jgi:hypothetical protein